MSAKGRTTRAAKNRRKRQYTPATSDESSNSDLESEQSDNEDHQTIPTPSIDSVLQQFASQANASASGKPREETPPQPKQQRTMRPIAVNTAGKQTLSKETRVLPMMRNFAPRIPTGHAVPRILNRPMQRIGDYSTPTMNNPSRIYATSLSAPTNHPPQNTLAANLAKVLNVPVSNEPLRRPMMAPVLRPSLLQNRNAFPQHIGNEKISSTTPEESAPFCKSCVNEFPNIIKSLDRLDNRINDMLNVMKMAMRKVNGGKNESPISYMPQRQVMNTTTGFTPRPYGNGNVGPIRVVTRKVVLKPPRASQGQTPKDEPVVPDVALSETESEPEDNLEAVYARLSALEREILQISPDKFDVTVLSELSDVIKDARATKVTSALDHLVKLGLIKSSKEKASNGSTVTFYKKNMKKFSQLNST